MRSSIFVKQFALYMGILLATVLFLGVAFSVVFRDQYLNEKEEQLIAQAEKVSNQYALAAYFGIINLGQFREDFRIFEDYMGAEAVLLDLNKSVVIASSSLPPNLLGNKMTGPDIDKAFEGNVIVNRGSSLRSILLEPLLTVQYPIKVNDMVIGVILMSSPQPQMQKTLSFVYKVDIVCILISLVIGFFVIYFSSKKISKPLIKMNEVAKIMAGGNFKQRIEIKNKDEVGQLAESFNEMAKSLNEIDESKRAFISNISHDLRTPLTSIQGFINAILDGTIESCDQQKYLQIALDETKRLTRLANEVLNVQRLESTEKNLNLENFDINETIRAVLLQNEHQIRNKKLQLNVLYAEDKSFVFADKEKILRVLYNLLDNAIKFTAENGIIEIETTIKDDKTVISVKDNGIGMTKEETEKIFDRFYKADQSRGMHPGGMGLGLSIVRDFIYMHEENLQVTSKKNEGTKFIFSLKSGTK